MNRILVVQFLALVALPAVAADSVAVFAVDNCTQDLTSNSARLLRKGLSDQGAAMVQSEEETLAALGGPVRGSLEDAERLLASARVTFLEDIDGAPKVQKALDEAAAILMSLPPSESRRWKALCDVLSFQSQVFYLYDKTKAEAAIEPILRVDQLFQVDRERYSPDMWKLVDRVRKNVKAKARATLSVTTRPMGLPVYVGGRSMGKSPVTVDLPPGQYRVEALFGKDRTLARTVMLKDAVAIELDQSLDGAVRVSSGPCLATSGTRDARLVAMMKLAAFLRVDQVVGVWQEEPAKEEVYVVAAAVETKSGQQLSEGKVKVVKGQVASGDVEKLGQFITKGDAVPPVKKVLAEPRPVPKELEARDDFVARDITRAGSTSSRRGWRTAAYVSGGVAVAALGVGVYGLVTASAKRSEQDDLRVNGVIPSDSLSAADRLESQAKKYKTVGIVGIATGAVAAGTAVGFYLYSTGGSSGGSARVGLTPSGAYFAASF